MFTIIKSNVPHLGNLTVLVDEKSCWMFVKEICIALKMKYTRKQIEDIVSQKNLLKLGYNNKQLNDIRSDIWKNKNDHSDKILINKFGVLQLLNSISKKDYDVNSIIEEFICITFKKSILEFLKQDISKYKTGLSELDRQKLRLFSDNKFEVVEAHKAILKLELASRRNSVEKHETEQCDRNLLVEEINKLKTENNHLKNLVGRGTEWSSIGFKKQEWKKRFGHVPDWKVLCEISKRLGIEPIKDIIEKDKKGVERKVNRYHVSVWTEYMLLETKNLLNIKD